MKILLPPENLLSKTGPVDYYYWNYKFPIKYLQLFRFKKIVQLLGNKKYTSLLEIGTGSGIFIPELSKHCEHLYACDIHKDYEKIENLSNYYKIDNFNYSSQSIEETTFFDNQFDVIVGVSVLEFVPDLVKASAEIRRILKKDGIFITICPMESGLLDSILSFYSKRSPKDEFGNSRQKVSKFLEANFEVEVKGYMMPIIGKYFPVYTYYKLKNVDY